MEQFKENTCSCSKCRSMCYHSPCIPHPDQMGEIVQKGLLPFFIPTLWLDMVEQKLYVVVAPKGQEHEIGDIPCHKCVFLGPGDKCMIHEIGDIPCHKCVFLGPGDKCMIHDVCKPMEGRLASCSNPDPNAELRRMISKEWEKSFGMDFIMKYFGSEIFKEQDRLNNLLKMRKLAMGL